MTDTVSRQAKGPRRTPPPRRDEAWDDRYKRIQAQYPSTRPDFAWDEALQSAELLGRLLHDLANIGWERPTRRGQRSRIDPEEGMVRIAAVLEGGPRLSALEADRAGEATTSAFPEALRELAAEANLTISGVANLEGITLSRTEIHRLMRGERAPTGFDMEQIADAFGKAPTYFHEYRVSLLAEAVVAHLEDAPELSVHAIRQLEASAPKRRKRR